MVTSTTDFHSIPSIRPNRLWVLLAFLAIYLIWGTTYLAIRFTVASIPPLISAGVRHSCAGLILLGIAWSRGYRPVREHWLAGTILGGLFFLIGHGSLHWSEQFVSSGLAALLIASEPLWILLIGTAMRQQKVNKLNGFGLLLGLTGVGMLTAQEFSSQISGIWGTVAVLVGAVSWAFGVCISPRLRLPRDAMGRAAIPLVCGAALLLTAATVSGEFSTIHWHSISVQSLLGLAYLIVFGSLVSFTAYIWLLQHFSPTLVATHGFVNPLVAVLVGWFLASEAMSLRLILSTLVILSAIFLIQRGEKQAQRASQS